MNEARPHRSRLLVLTLLFGVPINLSCEQARHGSQPNLPLPNVPAHVTKQLGMEHMPAVPNYLRGWYYVPETVATTEAFQKAVFGLGPLDPSMVFMLNIVTSAKNDCLYCLCAAFVMAKGAGVEEETLVTIQTDISSAALSEKDKALLLLALALTAEPTSVKPFVARASQAGWADAEIAHAIQVTSTMNMNNRMAEGFGYPPDWMHPYDRGASVPIRGCGTDLERARILEWFHIK